MCLCVRLEPTDFSLLMVSYIFLRVNVSQFVTDAGNIISVIMFTYQNFFWL